MLVAEIDPPIDLHARILTREQELRRSHREWWRPPRVLVIALAATGVALLIVMLAFAAHSRSLAPPKPANDHTPPTSQAMSRAWAMVDVDTGVISGVPASRATSGAFYVVSPDHSRVAFNNCCDWGGPVRVANRDGTQPRTISAPGTDGLGEEWSPDGTAVVYQQRPAHAGNQLGNLFVGNVATGHRTQVTNLDHKQWGVWFLYPSFAPDGRSVLYQRPSGHLPHAHNRSWNLWSAPIGGGKPTIIQRNATWGSYSPDGKQLAYLTGRNGSTISKLWIKNLAGGTPRLLVSGHNLQWVKWSPNGSQIAYLHDGSIDVVDIATGKTTTITHGSQYDWYDDHTLIYSTS
jgi:Tol biopolymer transport system component